MLTMIFRSDLLIDRIEQVHNLEIPSHLFVISYQLHRPTLNSCHNKLSVVWQSHPGLEQSTVVRGKSVAAKERRLLRQTTVVLAQLRSE